MCRSGQGVRASLERWQSRTAGLGPVGRAIVLLAAVRLLAVLSPLVVVASPAWAATPTITITTSYDDGAMGGNQSGSMRPASRPTRPSPGRASMTNRVPFAGSLTTDANGDASIDNACQVGFGPPDETITITYDGVSVTGPPPAQPPAPPTPTSTIATVSPSTTNFGSSVTYSVQVSTPCDDPGGDTNGHCCLYGWFRPPVYYGTPYFRP